MSDKDRFISGSVDVSSGSRERVALELMKYLRTIADPKFQDDVLAMFQRCLLAIDEPGTDVETLKQRVKP